MIATHCLNVLTRITGTLPTGEKRAINQKASYGFESKGLMRRPDEVTIGAVDERNKHSSRL